MNQNSFYLLTQQDIIDSVHSMIQDSSKLKTAIFKSIIMSSDVDKVALQKYINKVTAFIKIWSNYGDSLEAKMKESSGAENVRAIQYNTIKPFLYAKYDYASVLPFTDGVLKGIKSGKFSEAKDIVEFREFTARKAFDDRADSTGGLLDEVCNFSGPFNPSVKSDRKEASLYGIRCEQCPRTDNSRIRKSKEHVLSKIPGCMNHNGKPYTVKYHGHYTKA